MAARESGRFALATLAALLLACCYDWTSGPAQMQGDGGDVAPTRDSGQLGDVVLLDAGDAADTSPGDVNPGCQFLLDAGGACNDLPQLGTLMNPTCSTATAPMPTGGPAPVDGRYIVIGITLYGDCSQWNGGATSETFYLCNSVVQTRSDHADGSSDTLSGIQYFMASNVAPLTETCPNKLTLSNITYTSTSPTTFSTFFGLPTIIIQVDYQLAP